MFAKRFPLWFVVIPVFVFAGCSADSPFGILFNPPDVIILRVDRQNATPGSFASATVLIKNDGSGATAFNIVCDAKLKQGSYIVDEGAASGGSLESGESRSITILFGDLQDHSQYSSAVYYVTWVDAEGTAYSNEINNP